MRGLSSALVFLAILSSGCQRPPTPPNVLWVVWDTARADRMSVYGHDLPTTPFLETWATGARVFDDVRSTASYTLPSHASMFTGLLPSEHCTHNATRQLDEAQVTIAELLRDAGYGTFLYSANPHISNGGNFDQGFDTEEHPWSPAYEARAKEIVLEKLAADRSSELPERLETQGASGLTAWNIKAAGELAEDALLSWLDEKGDGPWFAFLNYMEAHRPLIPPREFREALMDGADVERSYEVDRTWDSMWAYTFGLQEYSDEELRLTRATYDAAILELDTLFESLVGALERAGALDNTIIVLTSDHGEHLGEQHMLDHQYTVYEPALRIPLILHAPGRVEPGRDARRAMNFDLFPTLLRLTGVTPETGMPLHPRDLLAPEGERTVFAEEPASSNVGVAIVRRTYPDFDPSPWQRRLRAFYDGNDKFVWGSDGRHQLFDLSEDPDESTNLVDVRAERAEELKRRTTDYFDTLTLCTSLTEQYEQLSPEQREMLKSLGYLE